MRLEIEKSELTNPTLEHLEAWLLAIEEHLQNDHVFDSLDQLAITLEEWKSEFCRPEKNGNEHQGDHVLIILYGDDLILICDQASGEFIKVKEAFPKKAKKRVVITGEAPLFNISRMMKKALVICLSFLMATPAFADGIFKPRNGKAVVKKTQKQKRFKGYKLKYAKRQGIDLGNNPRAYKSQKP
ncbi:hypothetical protein [Mongoliibacter ruber]|uniref:Uncharacterized protein n=1 Tax=Mongoliibacter ruber TaxID=1750599 RepID=A0A2T0WV95_9BACT|nr:hypothetical protein [Mongoliibacter ruber]PRY90621.1 hypothetical protein CLW00_101285 [Mongoliibacter ruber]